eukprot:gene8583-6023_t
MKKVRRAASTSRWPAETPCPPAVNPCRRGVGQTTANGERQTRDRERWPTITARDDRRSEEERRGAVYASFYAFSSTIYRMGMPPQGTQGDTPETFDSTFIFFEFCIIILLLPTALPTLSLMLVGVLPPPRRIEQQNEELMHNKPRRHASRLVARGVSASKSWRRNILCIHRALSLRLKIITAPIMLKKEKRREEKRREKKLRTNEEEKVQRCLHSRITTLLTTHRLFLRCSYVCIEDSLTSSMQQESDTTLSICCCQITRIFTSLLSHPSYRPNPQPPVYLHSIGSRLDYFNSLLATFTTEYLTTEHTIRTHIVDNSLQVYQVRVFRCTHRLRQAISITFLSLLSNRIRREAPQLHIVVAPPRRTECFLKLSADADILSLSSSQFANTPCLFASLTSQAATLPQIIPSGPPAHGAPYFRLCVGPLALDTRPAQRATASPLHRTHSPQPTALTDSDSDSDSDKGMPLLFQAPATDAALNGNMKHPIREANDTAGGTAERCVQIFMPAEPRSAPPCAEPPFVCVGSLRLAFAAPAFSAGAGLGPLGSAGLAARAEALGGRLRSGYSWDSAGPHSQAAAEADTIVLVGPEPRCTSPWLACDTGRKRLREERRVAEGMAPTEGGLESRALSLDSASSGSSTPDGAAFHCGGGPSATKASDALGHPPSRPGALSLAPVRLVFPHEALLDGAAFAPPPAVSAFLSVQLQCGDGPVPFWLAALAHHRHVAGRTRLGAPPAWLLPLPDARLTVAALHQAAICLAADLLEADREARRRPGAAGFSPFLAFTDAVFAAAEDAKLYKVFLEACGPLAARSGLRAAHLHRSPTTAVSDQLLHRTLADQDAALRQRVEQLQERLRAVQAAPDGPDQRRRRHDTATVDSAGETELVAKLLALQKRATGIAAAQHKLRTAAQRVTFPFPTAFPAAGQAGAAPHSGPYDPCKAAPCSLLELIHYFALAWLQGLAPATYDDILAAYAAFGVESRERDAHRSPWWIQTALPWSMRVGRWRLWWTQKPPPPPPPAPAPLPMSVGVLHRSIRAGEASPGPGADAAVWGAERATAALPLCASVGHTTTRLLLDFVLEGSSGSEIFVPVSDALLLLQWMPVVSRELLLEHEVRLCLSRAVNATLQAPAADLQPRGFRLVAATVVWLSCVRACSAASPAGLSTWKELLWDFFAAQEEEAPEGAGAGLDPATRTYRVAMTYFSRLWLTFERGGALQREAGRRRGPHRRSASPIHLRGDESAAGSDGGTTAAPLSVGSLSVVDSSLFGCPTPAREREPEPRVDPALLAGVRRHHLQRVKRLLLELLADLEPRISNAWAASGVEKVGAAAPPHRLLEQRLARQFISVGSRLHTPLPLRLRDLHAAGGRCAVFGEDAAVARYASGIPAPALLDLLYDRAHAEPSDDALLESCSDLEADHPDSNT